MAEKLTTSAGSPVADDQNSLFAVPRGPVPMRERQLLEKLARFSTVAGEMGAADAERDARGVAPKFYTEEGNWNLVGNNAPVFFVRDPVKFPEFIHTRQRHFGEPLETLLR